MMSEYKFKQLVLTFRKEIFDKYSFLKGTISHKERQVKKNEYGVSLAVTSSIFLHEVSDNVFYLSMYGLNGKFADVRNDIINMFTEIAKNRNIEGFFRVSDIEETYSIGENADKVLSWINNVENIEMNFRGEIRFDFNGLNVPEYKYRFSFDDKPCITVCYKDSYPTKYIDVRKLYSIDEIHSFINEMHHINKRMNDEVENMKKFLLREFTCVKVNENIPFYLNIFGKNEFISINYGFSIKNNKEKFSCFIQDEYIEEETLENLVLVMKDKWNKYIKENRVRQIFNFKKSAEIS